MSGKEQRRKRIGRTRAERMEENKERGQHLFHTDSYQTASGKQAIENLCPLLVIGLGGCGFDGLSAAKEKLYQCYGIDSSKHSCVVFLQIDTDERDYENNKKNKTAYKLKEEEFLVYKNADIGALLHNRDKNALAPEIEEWLSTDIPVTQIVHGAAGIRQAGRLLLFLNSTEIRNKLEIVIDRLLRTGRSESGRELELDQEPFRIAIVTGLGGGTGSGTFVDVSYMVRQIVENKGGRPSITGIVVMPDVLSEDVKIDPLTRKNIKRNGFAALKELDFLMNLDSTHDCFAQKYPDGFALTENVSKSPIFEQCILMSGMGEHRVLYPDARQHTYDLVAEAILDLASGASFTKSFFSNIPSLQGTAMGTMAERKAEHYNYITFGSSTVYFDMAYAFNLFMKKVTGNADNVKNKSLDVKKIVEDSILPKIKEYEGIWNAMKYPTIYPQKSSEQVREMKNNKYKKYILEDEKDTAMEELCQAEGEKISIRWRNEVIDAIKKELQDIEESTEYSADEKENKKNELITESRKRLEEECKAEKNLGTNADIQEINKIIKKIKTRRRESKRREKELNHRIGELDTHTKKEMYADILENQKCEIQNALRITSKLDYQKNVKYEEWRRFWEEELNEYYNEEFEKELKGTWDRSNHLFGSQALTYEMRQKKVADVQQALEEILGDENAKAAIQNAQQALIDSVNDPKQQNKWNNQERDVYIDELTAACCADSFQKIEKLTLDEVMKQVLQINENELEEEWLSVLSQMMEHSRILYAKRPLRTGEVRSLPINQRLLLPKGCNELKEAGKKLCENIAHLQMEESDIKHRISIRRYVLCKKLDDYFYIEDLESAYRDACDRKGLHLREHNEKHPNLNWKNLSSPVYHEVEQCNEEDYEDFRNDKYYFDVFDQAKNLEIITYEQSKRCYVLKKGKLSDLTSEDILLSNREGDEEDSSYEIYCKHWFTKMFSLRAKVAEAVKKEE